MPETNSGSTTPTTTGMAGGAAMGGSSKEQASEAGRSASSPGYGAGTQQRGGTGQGASSAAASGQGSAREGSGRDDSGSQPESREGGGDPIGQIRDKAERVAQDAAEAGKSAIAREVDEFAQGIRRAAEGWQDNRHAWVANYLDDAADGLARASDRLRDRGIGSIVSDTENFARRNPGMFAACCAVAGFALVRFLRSSGRPAYAGRGGSGRGAGTYSG